MSVRIRGIIYFLFLAGFLISAPLVVFYTAGYRFNFKTGRIAQTGIISLTSFPKGASVQIDGKLYDGRTPVVLGNILPGEHEIFVTKDGYSSWTKKLEVVSQDTTFIKDVILFLIKEPVRIRSMKVISVAHAPEGNKTAYALLQDNWLELWMFNSSDETETLLARVPADATSSAEIYWSASGTFIITSLRSTTDRLYSLIDTRDLSSSSIEALVPGTQTGVWDTDRDNIFFVENNTGIWAVDSSAKTSEKLLEDTNAVLSFDGTDLLVAEAVNDRMVISRKQGEQTSILAYLPLGTYTFHPSPDGIIFLEDTARQRIILLDGTGGDQPILLNTDANLWNWEPGGQRLLYSNGFDLHIFDPSNYNDEILTRLSDPVTGLAWYPEPKSAVLYSQKESLYAIELDRRNGRNVTTLAIADEIRDIWVDENGENVFFFGTISGEAGLYKRQLER